MTKAKEFRNLGIEEIHTRIREFKKELMKDNVHIFSGTAAANPGKVRHTKKNIARLLTILKEKEVSNK